MKSAELQRYAKQQAREYKLNTDSRCEVSHLLRRCDLFKRWENSHCLPALVVHHISGRFCEEQQLFCNLILVSNAAHEWGHQSGNRDYNVSHAFEAACLISKWNRQHKESFYRTSESTEVHWSFDVWDAIRSKCVSHKTIRDRVEFLEESLRGSPFASLSQELLEKVA